MDYREVKRFVLDNSFNLEVYESVLNRGETVFKDYGTITWTALDSDNLPKGVYVTGSHDYTGEVLRIITVQGSSVRDRVVTLLHEYGHHTSYQDTTIIKKEVNA